MINILIYYISNLIYLPLLDIIRRRASSINPNYF